MFFSILACNLHAEENISCDQEVEEPLRILTLESGINRALSANRQFMNSFENLEKSQLALEIAEVDFDLKITPNAEGGYAGGTHYTPGIKYGFGVDFYKKFKQGTRINFSPSFHKRNEHFHTDLNTTLIQPLLRGFGRDYTLNGLYSAEFGVRSAIRNLYSSQVGLILRTIQSLYDVVRAEETLKLNQASYDRLKGYFRAAKMKEKIGLSDALDVFRAEGELKHAEEALTGSQVRYQDTQDTLRDLLALPLDAEIKVEVPLVYNEVSMDVDEAIETALSNRIEMDNGRDQISESQRMVRIAKDNLYPELNLIVNYNNSGADEIFNRSCFSKRQNTYSVGFTTSTDFNQTAQDAAYDQSVIGVTSSQRALEQATANIIVEVKKSLRNLDQTFKRIALQKEQIHNGTGELRLSLLKFNRGFANNFDVIQAEKAMRAAELNLISAVIDHIIGQYQLMSTLGLLADKPIINRDCN